MPIISSDSLQLAHVLETTPGVTPANPAFHLWRTTGESLVFEPQTQESGELGGQGRFRKPSNVTGFSINGGINFELSTFPALKEAIAGVLAAKWGECPLTGAAGGAIDAATRITVGKQLQTFTIEKRFPNVAAVPGAVPTVVAAAGAGTLTFAGAAAVGTGMVVIDVAVNGGATQHVTVAIPVGDDAAAVAGKVATALNALPGMTAAAAADVVTITPAAGNVDTLTAVTGNDQYFYQRFKGCTYSALTLTAAPNAVVTGSVTVVGGEPELDIMPLPGATYVSAGNEPVFTAPQIMEASFGAMGLSSHCWTELSINLDSANRGVPCIGSKGDREVVLGTLSAQVTGTVYFQDQEILQHLLNNTNVGNSVITLSDGGANLLRWDFYGMKPISGQLAAGGAGQDLVIPVTFEPTPVKVCEDASGSAWDSGLIVSTVDTPPTLP